MGDYLLSSCLSSLLINRGDGKVNEVQLWSLKMMGDGERLIVMLFEWCIMVYNSSAMQVRGSAPWMKVGFQDDISCRWSGGRIVEARSLAAER